MGAVGMIGGDPTLAKPSYVSFMADYGTAFRTFKHGLLHGFIAGFFCCHHHWNQCIIRKKLEIHLINGGFDCLPYVNGWYNLRLV
jgi:hypothetical protein